MKFIVALLIKGLVDLGFVAGGIYSVMNNHAVVGGWLIAAAITSLMVNGVYVGTDQCKSI